MSIPSSFQSASWRGTTRVDLETQEIGVSFNLEDGSIVRLKLSTDSARNLSESVAEYLKAVG